MKPNKNKRMKRYFSAFAFILSAVLLLSSCLNDDVDKNAYPKDAAIISFSLGNLSRQMVTKAKNGSDSTYTATITGSNYKFYIDQINHQIYNPDSLPYGTNVKRALCNITSKNSGVVTIKSLISDTLFYYNSTDSIDFSEPRTLKVHSYDGTNQVSYTVKVNVHQEKPDTFLWHATSRMDAFAQAKHMKAFALNGRIIVFAGYEEEGAIYSCEESNNAEWRLETWDLGRAVPFNAYENVAASDQKIYINLSGDIFYSTDGIHWDQSGEMCPGRLIGATNDHLFALVTGGIARSDDEGATWETEKLDSDEALLPTDEVSFCRLPSKVNESVSNIVLIGNRSVSFFYDDVRAHVWNKVDDMDDKDEPWMYVSSDDQPTYILPRLTSLTAVVYNNYIIAAGGQGLGACQNSAFEHLFQSNEGGVLWQRCISYKLPDDFSCGNAFAMTVDSQNYLWLFCSETGIAWRGRMSGENGSKNQTSFTE